MYVCVVVFAQSFAPFFNALMRGRGRAARRGRRPLDLIGPSEDKFSVTLVLTSLCRVPFPLAVISDATIDKRSLRRSSFERASRSLAKTGF